MSVTKAQFDAYVRSMKTLSDAAQRALLKLWPKIDTSSVEAMRADLLRYVPSIVERFGHASAALSARFYDTVREASQAGGDYRAVTSDNTRFGEVERDVKFALSDAFTGASVTAFIAATVDRSVKQYGRDTMMLNSVKDKWARGYQSIPSPTACAFCIMKATQTYKNYMGEPLETEIDADAWHDNCDCQLIPVFDAPPSWFDRDHYREMYEDGMKQAVEDAGGDWSRNMKASEVLAGIRKANELEH